MNREEVQALRVGDYVIHVTSGRVYSVVHNDGSNIPIDLKSLLTGYTHWKGFYSLEQFTHIPVKPDESVLKVMGYPLTGEVVDCSVHGHGNYYTNGFSEWNTEVRSPGMVASLEKYSGYRWVVECTATSDTPEPIVTDAPKTPQSTIEERATEHAMELLAMLQRVDSSDFDCDWTAVQLLINKVQTGVE
jgi:hypothetical protein